MIITLDERSPAFDEPTSFIAANATMIGDVTLGTSTSVWFQAVIRGDNDAISIGSRSNVQDGAVLHVDPGIPLWVGTGVTVGHRAVLHGCTVGDNCLIGIGSIILNHATIGTNSIVGANTLVTEGKSFPDGVLLMGSPARVVRELNADEQNSIRLAADAYVAKIGYYRDNTIPL